MLFCSQQFLLFFLAVFVLYWLLPWDRPRIWLLLVASFVFYSSWNHWLALLIVFTSTLDYLIARRLDASKNPRERKILLTVTICSNLGVLIYFKYADFFLKSLGEALHAAGMSASLPVLEVILPIGISFYTFEAISYVVDVYRGTIKAERRLSHFLLFILFFPHLIAGPIVRGSDFLPQIQKRKRWDWMRVNVGIQLFALGMFKKLAIADRMVLLVDPVFADPGAYQGFVLWLAAIAFAVQVYCDFSGYTDMALGSAHLLGYSLAENFNLPYLARNISDFWRRWHISLSSWLRDYLFIPLGGSKFGRWVTYRNFLIVMGLGGLWHGAAWTFIVFGLIHGVWLSLHRAFREYAEARPWLHDRLQSRVGTAFCIAGTFLTFCCTLVIFRSETLASGWTYLSRMFTWSAQGLGEPVNLVGIAILAGFVFVGHLVGRTGRWRDWLAALPSPVRGVGVAVAMTLAMVLVPAIGKVFIYFQF